MSVIFFDAQSLGQVAALVASRDTTPRDRRNTIERLSRFLGEISQANCEAYNHTYNDGALPFTAPEIAAQALLVYQRQLTPKELRHVLSTAQLLHYNCMANDGTDFLAKSPSACYGLAVVLNKILGIWGDRLDAESYQRADRQ